MEKKRTMRVPEFKRIGKDIFVRKFINRPLEKYADRIYDFLLSAFNEKNGFFALVKEHKSWFTALYKLAQVTALVSDLRDEEWLNQHYYIDDPGIIHSLTCHLKDVLIEELKRVEAEANIISFSVSDGPDIRSLANRWQSIVNLIPSEFNINKDTNEAISDIKLKDLIFNINFLLKDARDLIVRKNESIVNSLLLSINSYGIPLNNALYRDVYDCLELANLIPDEQLKVHKASTNRYVRENFIKAKVKRFNG